MCKNHVAKLHIGSKTIYFWIWNFKVVAKLLYYVVVHLDLVVTTSKTLMLQVRIYEPLFQHFFKENVVRITFS